MTVQELINELNKLVKRDVPVILFVRNRIHDSEDFPAIDKAQAVRLGTFAGETCIFITDGMDY
jgi:hypothetical protein